MLGSGIYCSHCVLLLTEYFAASCAVNVVMCTVRIFDGIRVSRATQYRPYSFDMSDFFSSFWISVDL